MTDSLLAVETAVVNGETKVLRAGEGDALALRLFWILEQVDDGSLLCLRELHGVSVLDQ